MVWLDSKAFRNDSNRIEKLLDSPISVLVSVWDTAAKEKKIVRHFRRKIKMVWRKIQCENNYLMIQGFFSCWELNGSDEKYYLQFHISNTNWLSVKKATLDWQYVIFPFLKWERILWVFCLYKNQSNNSLLASDNYTFLFSTEQVKSKCFATKIR